MPSKTTDVSRASTPNRVADAIRALQALDVTRREHVADRLPEVAVINNLTDDDIRVILAAFPDTYTGSVADLDDGGDDPTDYQVDPWTELADHLLELAEAAAALAGRGLPAPDYTGLTMQVARGATDDEIVSAVDTIGVALIGKTGEDDVMCNGTTIHYGARGSLESLRVSVFQALARTAEPAVDGDA